MQREIELLELWERKVEDPLVAADLATLRAKGDEAIVDAFYQELEFGTAGLHGIIGAGTNRMNIYTVGRATQGFADYLNANFEHPSVAIGRDSRNLGDEFVRRAACVFAANGVKAYVFPRIEPTPAVSFAVRDLACSGGVCVTASHNPAPYNGYKENREIRLDRDNYPRLLSATKTYKTTRISSVPKPEDAFYPLYCF